MEKLIEFMDEARMERLPLTESEQGSSGAAGWVAPVWVLDVINLNGRIYSTELAERIIAEGKVTTALDGHWADQYEEYGATKAICKDPFIKDGKMWVHIDFVDKAYEELLSSLMENGVKIGVSSCGYGETDAYGHVKEDTYEVVRYLDFVQVPAGGVYAQKEEKEKAKRQESAAEGATAPEAPAAVGELAKSLADIFVM